MSRAIRAMAATFHLLRIYRIDDDRVTLRHNSSRAFGQASIDLLRLPQVDKLLRAGVLSPQHETTAFV